MADEKQTSPVPNVTDLFGDEFAVPEAPVEKTNANPNAEENSPTPQAQDGTQTEEKFRREIDLGDGSGKQVFEADTAEELIDKLTTAQENATRKIREQQYELRRAQRAKPEKTAPVKPMQIGQPKQFTADELFQIGQELSSNPGAAFDKILQAQTGMTTEQLKTIGSEFANMQQARLITEAETSFLQNHQDVDYLPTPDNARLIQKFLQDEKLPYTAANLEYAFQELSESGLLDMPELEKNENNDSKNGTENHGERIVVQQHTRRKSLSTGLRTQDGGVRPKVEKTTESGLTEAEVEEIYRLPLDQARAKILAKMRGQSTSGQRK